MALSDLDKLIADMSSISTSKRMNAFLKPHLDELIASGLAVMGIRTIGDTNQAKSLFVDIARNELGRDISWIYDAPTNLWNNKRSKGGYEGYSVIRTEQGVEIEMRDDGLFGQEYYGTSEQISEYTEYPSPRRIGSQYEARHISGTQDDLDDGKIAEFEAILDKIENLIVDRFEGRY